MSAKKNLILNQKRIMQKLNKDWFVVMTKPKQEQVARKNLLNQKFEVFLPQINHSDINSSFIPLFPGYLFVSFDISRPHWLKIGNTRGVKKLLSSNINPSRVDKKIINILLKSTNSFGIIKKSYLNYKLNQNIEIVNGPFTKMLGKIISLGTNGRIKILLENIVINLDKKDILPV